MARGLRIFGPAARRGSESFIESERAGTGPSDPDAVTVEYLRRVYANNRDWYAISESKAQILLGAHGAFISIVAGTLLGVSGNLPAATKARLGPETWAFLAVTVLCVVGAVSCASLAMWSLHGKPSRKQFARLGVDPDDPSTYVPEALWYFGHMALLKLPEASSRLRQTTRDDEIRALSYHTVELSARVLRKHRYVNTGWVLTAAGLIALTGVAVSIFIRSVVG